MQCEQGKEKSKKFHERFESVLLDWNIPFVFVLPVLNTQRKNVSTQRNMILYLKSIFR